MDNISAGGADNVHQLNSRKSSLSTLSRLQQMTPYEQFAELFKKHEGTLIRISVRVTGNQDLAEEILSRSMVKGIEHYADFKGQSNFVTWMSRLIANECVDYFRSPKNRQHASYQTVVEDGLEPACSSADDPQTTLEIKHFMALLAHNIQKLPPNRGEALLMSVVEDMSVAQIAQAFKQPENTIKSYIYQARQTLRTSSDLLSFHSSG